MRSAVHQSAECLSFRPVICQQPSDTQRVLIRRAGPCGLIAKSCLPTGADGPLMGTHSLAA